MDHTYLRARPWVSVWEQTWVSAAEGHILAGVLSDCARRGRFVDHRFRIPIQTLRDGPRPVFAERGSITHSLSVELRVMCSASRMKDGLCILLRVFGPDRKKVKSTSCTWIAASRGLIHCLVSPLPETAVGHTAPWMPQHLKTASRDHLPCAELRLLAPHNMIELDHRSRMLI